MVLKRTINIKFSVRKFVIKPILATLVMCVTSYVLYVLLAMIIPWKIAAIIAIGFAVVIYALAVFGLGILNKEEIHRLPKGKFIYKMLVKMKIYKED